MIIYQNYAAEMLAKFGRISKMVEHSPSIGNYHESIVKNYLRNFLSSSRPEMPVFNIDM
jgi:hypothetical protein